MKKKLLSLILLCAFLVVGSCFTLTACNNDTTEPYVLASGDVLENIKINETYLKNFEAEELKDSKGNTHTGYNLYEILISNSNKKTNPIRTDGKVMITAKEDNLSVFLNFNNLKEAIIELKDNKFNIVSNLLPAPVNIKNVGEILFVQNNRYNFPEVTKNMMVKTCGDLLKSTTKPMSEELLKNKYSLQKFSKFKTEFSLKKVFPKFLLDLKNAKVTAILKNANQVEIDKNATLKYENGILNAYLNNKIVAENIGTIGVGEISGNISDTYRDVEKALNKDKKVMVIELDGFSYFQYARYKTELDVLYNNKAVAKYSMYPSISNVGLAGILTGKMPLENGIVKKHDKQLTSPTIFDLAYNMGKSYSYVEGNQNLLNNYINDEKFTILSSKTDEFGTTDAGVFENALKEKAKNPDLMYVHFHGIDDVNHNYNAYSDEAKQKIYQSDNYVKQLIDGFNGVVIICADHGHHVVIENGLKKGKHGTFCFEDVVTPYFVFEV